MANHNERELLKKLGLEETSENTQTIARFKSRDVLDYSHDNDKRY